MEDRRARAPAARPGQPPYGHSERRARPRLTDQIQVIRELWLLREQARVQAAERCFLTELERLLSGRPYYQTSDQQTPSPPRPPHGMPNIGVVSPTAPAPPPLPPFPPASPPVMSAVTFLDDGLVFESHPPPRGDHAPVRERPGSVSQEMEQARASQLVTVCKFISSSCPHAFMSLLVLKNQMKERGITYIIRLHTTIMYSSHDSESQPRVSSTS